jgi:hypothetical protein
MFFFNLGYLHFYILCLSPVFFHLYQNGFFNNSFYFFLMNVCDLWIHFMCVCQEIFILPFCCSLKHKSEFSTLITHLLGLASVSTHCRNQARAAPVWNVSFCSKEENSRSKLSLNTFTQKWFMAFSSSFHCLQLIIWPCFNGGDSIIYKWEGTVYTLS